MTMDLLAWITVPACLASHLAKEHQETPKCIACVMDVFPSLICNTSSLPPAPAPAMMISSFSAWLLVPWNKEPESARVAITAYS